MGINNKAETITMGDALVWPLRTDGSPDLQNTLDAYNFARRCFDSQIVKESLVFWAEKYGRLFKSDRKRGFPDIDVSSRLVFNLQLIREALEEWERLEEDAKRKNHKEG